MLIRPVRVLLVYNTPADCGDSREMIVSGELMIDGSRLGVGIGIGIGVSRLTFHRLS